MANNKKQTSPKSTSEKKATKRRSQDERTTTSEEQESSFASEIKVWVLCAVMLILELGNFGLCGFINNVSRFFFGLFGVIEYIIPVAVMFSAFFLYVNEYKKRAVQKVIFGSLVLLCLGMIAHMMESVDNSYEFMKLFRLGFDDKVGGGILCGTLAYALIQCVGTIGTYIIIVLAIIIFVILFAEFSVIDFIRDLATINSEEEDDELEMIQPRRKEKNISGGKRYDERIVEEDDGSLRKKEKKKVSLLEQISVLPEGETGNLQNISEQKPIKEDVHEIVMKYEVPLPGEGMESGEIAITKETPKPKRKRKTKAEPMSTQNTGAPVADSSIQMENTTAKAEPVAAAKEVGKSDDVYRFPPLDLLKKSKSQVVAKDEVIRNNALKLQEVLQSFGVNVHMTNYSCGPSVTRYEMVPEQGVKVSKITGLADDIMMNLAAQSIRIEAPIPGKSAVGIEIPNDTRSGVGFRELIDTDKFIKHPSKIAFAVGKDIEGNVIVEDIAKMPHLLIAGATGSGKSVCTNTLIMSILYKAKPDEVKLILIDPKQVELKVYNGIPHLLTPVVTDPKKAAGALNWAVGEMTKRYQLFSECNVRNIQGYNAKVKELETEDQLSEVHLKPMPQIVIIVDELADLMMVAKAEVEEAIVRLAQLARAAGIHLVIATQRPSVDVVTGLIKANVPSRVALSVSSGVDSRTIIDSVGAEKLLGNGDMLFYPTMYPKPLRVQGAYISDDEVLKVVDFLKEQNGETQYSEEMTNQITSGAGMSDGSVSEGSGNGDSDQDEYFVQAGRFIIEKNKASIGMLQRMYKIGFNRAARIMDQLHAAGVVGPEEGTKPRQILMTIEEFDAYVDELF